MANTSIVIMLFFSILLIYISHKSFYITVCLYLRAFLVDWTNAITEAGQLTQDKTSKTHLALRQKLIDAVVYHLEILKFVIICC